MAGALRSDRVVLSRSSSLLRPHPTPCRLDATSRWPVIRTGCSRRPCAGADDGLPSSRAYRLPIPLSLPRGVPRRLHLPGLRRLPWAFAVIFSGSAPPCPLSGLASRGCKIRLMLRAGQSLPLEGLSTLGFDAGRFPPTPPTCYRASWTATRTGLTPAGRHELVDVGHLNYTTSSRIWFVPTPTGHTKLPLGERDGGRQGRVVFCGQPATQDTRWSRCCCRCMWTDGHERENTRTDPGPRHDSGKSTNLV